jgi:hypothetical protein
MHEIKFRRSHSGTAMSSVSVKRLFLVIILFFVLVAVGFYFKNELNSPKKFSSVLILYVDKSKIIINKDTTQFDLFASKLLQVIKSGKRDGIISVDFYVPETVKAYEILDLIAIVQSIENTKLNLKKYKYGTELSIQRSFFSRARQ